MFTIIAKFNGFSLAGFLEWFTLECSDFFAFFERFNKSNLRIE